MKISIKLNSGAREVAGGRSIMEALETLGVAFGVYPGEGELQAPCKSGGCYSCLVMVDGLPFRSCVTPVAEGMDIRTKLPAHLIPRRIVHGPLGHSVGGKATPWWLKSRSRFIEVAIWTAGCNLRCPQCQNYTTTYDSQTAPVSPDGAAELVTFARRSYQVNRMAISGGEPSLNRPWLIGYFQALKRLNPDPEARLHLDSNGTLLTREYIDELVGVGVTDIGVEPKGVYPETFMRITGIKDRGLAERFLKTSWEAVSYLVEQYKGRVFVGVGLPYNRELISLDEVMEFGERLALIDPFVQLCVLDYFPSFKRRGLKRPSVDEMLSVKKTLNDAGLKTVIVQTEAGHRGP
ncbi:MAG: radical SAM protein [candidate division NC10 bacterium]|nr:radical SAM protein [candidate division NC10 bacterium]